MQASVTALGTADGLASHVSRTRRAHHVTAAAMYVLIDKACILIDKVLMVEKCLSHSATDAENRAIKSTISLLAAYASPPAHQPDIPPLFEIRELPTL